MNVFKEFSAVIAKAVEAEAASGGLPSGLDLSRVAVEPPRDPSHGDMATNAAMVLAKPAGQQPRALADKLIKRLKEHPEVTEASMAGPGFINLRLKDQVWRQQLGAM